MSEFKSIFQTYQRTTLLSVVTIICWMAEVSMTWLGVEGWLNHVLPISLPCVVACGLAIDYMVKNW